MTEEEFNALLQQAGTEWNALRGDMKSYLRIIIRLAREFERNSELSVNTGATQDEK